MRDRKIGVELSRFSSSTFASLACWLKYNACPKSAWRWQDRNHLPHYVDLIRHCMEPSEAVSFTTTEGETEGAEGASLPTIALH